MVRRVGGLFEQVYDFAALLGDARRAARGTGRTASACRFFFRLEPELLALQRELRDGSYEPGPHHYFYIRDPKPRRIAVAPFRDRVVHHAVVRVLTPVFEPAFIHDSYATRAGKGSHAAVDRAQVFLRTHHWYLKADVAAFFDSVDHERLLGRVARKIKDPLLLGLIERIVRGGNVEGRGLPIGNLPSQFLANVYLDPLDHFVKERLRVRGYLRYMDDFLLFGPSSAVLGGWRDEVEGFLAEHLLLELNPQSTWINRRAHGLSFLGRRIHPNLVRSRGENRRRSLRKLAWRHRAWLRGDLSDRQWQDSLTAATAYHRYYAGAGPLLYPQPADGHTRDG